jgi:allantoinase
MSGIPFILRSRRVVTPQGVRPAAVHTLHGRISAVGDYSRVPPGSRLEDFGDLVLMPGLVDTHVHINEPGRADWEGFSSATRAAAAGGVTTLIEMPLNSIPATTSAAAFSEKIAAAQGQLRVDAGFWGGLVPGNTQELKPLWEAGVFGFKCFLVPSGVPEFAQVTEEELRRALPVLASLGAPLLAHAELPGPIEEQLRHLSHADPRRYLTWLLSRPPAAETQAIELLLRLSREYAARIHIVHVSAAEGAALVARARQQGLPVSAETCPHYLLFGAEEVPDGATPFKCAPPVRGAANRERLWAALESGALDFVVTDHSPAPPAMKCADSGDFLRAWGGIASLELSLAAVWSEASRRGAGLAQICEWMCSGPARLAGLENRKGSIAVGYDADFAVWDPDAVFRVAPERLHQRHKLTPYAGRELCGVVHRTYLRGCVVFDRGAAPGGQFPGPPAGSVLKREC